ncbi:MAG: hypothetical protein EBU88_19845, partial [Acidobacteria bacterium]|nr:hypothetical protein [Acidobacteriota bacterium]
CQLKDSADMASVDLIGFSNVFEILVLAGFNLVLPSPIHDQRRSDVNPFHAEQIQATQTPGQQPAPKPT